MLGEEEGVANSGPGRRGRGEIILEELNGARWFLEVFRVVVDAARWNMVG